MILPGRKRSLASNSFSAGALAGVHLKEKYCLDAEMKKGQSYLLIYRSFFLFSQIHVLNALLFYTERVVLFYIISV